MRDWWERNKPQASFVPAETPAATRAARGPLVRAPAAVASAMGYRVRLVSYAAGMLRPFVLPGTTYGKVCVAEVCDVCGAPTKLEFEE